MHNPADYGIYNTFKIRQTPQEARRELVKAVGLRHMGIPVAEATIRKLELKAQGEEVAGHTPGY